MIYVAPALPLCKSLYAEHAAVSQDALDLDRTYESDLNRFRTTASHWLPSAMQELASIAIECRQDGWDGDGSFAVQDATIQRGRAVLRALFDGLPATYPAPIIAPEADGDISIGWFLGDGKMLDFSVGLHGRIIFAGQFDQGGARHGWMPLGRPGEAMPRDTLRECLALLNNLLVEPVQRRAA